MKKTACVHVGILTLKSREFSPEPPHLQSIFVQNELFLPEKDSSNIHKAGHWRQPHISSG